MRPYAPGKKSAAKAKVETDGQRQENISQRDSNYGAGIYYRQRNVKQVSLVQLAVTTFTRTWNKERQQMRRRVITELRVIQPLIPSLREGTFVVCAPKL